MIWKASVLHIFCPFFKRDGTIDADMMNYVLEVTERGAWHRGNYVTIFASL